MPRKCQTSATASVNDLPREILVYIFTYVKETETQTNFIQRVARVCKNWQEAATDITLWSDFDGALPFQDLLLLCEKECFKNIDKLVMGKMKHIPTSSDLEAVYKSLPCIKSIDFSKALKKLEKGQCNFLTNLIDHCPDLEEIIINSSDSKSTYKPFITPRLFREFLHCRGERLTSLEFSNVLIINVKNILVLIAIACPNLEELIIQHLHKRSTNYLFPIEYMQSCLRKLRILRLGFPFVYQSAGTYKDTGFPDLETFAHPSKEDLLDEFYFRKLLDLSPNLTELDVRGCARLTCTEMCSLPSRNVRKLYISHTKLYCSDVFLCILVKWCRNLVLLDISGSKEERINHHFWWVFHYGNLRRLEILNLNHTLITTATLRLILQNCPHLKFLDLRSCNDLSRACRKEYKGEESIRKLRIKLNALEILNI